MMTGGIVIQRATAAPKYAPIGGITIMKPMNQQANNKQAAIPEIPKFKGAG